MKIKHYIPWKCRYLHKIHKMQFKKEKKHWTDLFDIFSVKQVFVLLNQNKIRKHWWNIKTHI